jgi:adenylate cyclase
MVQYFERCGARVVAFDMLFKEKGSASDQLSDETFAELLGETKLPVVFATEVSGAGVPGRFVPPVKDPVFGAVNTEGLTLREYPPLVKGFPSLAFRTASIFTGHEPAQKTPFYMHFYGPREPAPGRTTFPYVKAKLVLAATRGKGKEVGLDDALFRNRIVIVGATATSLYDAKVTPFDDVLPGVEWQATAVENLLGDQRVHGVPMPLAIAITFCGSFAAAAGSLVPRRTSAKLTACVLATAAVVALAIWLFRRPEIRWLSLAAPLVALLVATVAAFAWSYFTEGRQRQFFSNMFALSTSPIIAEEFNRNPDRFKSLGGERREITVMFTDLAGFTDLSETMEVVTLARLMNLYMEAMSEEIVRQDGYLDKYIGDAIMSFWNGFVDQPDHAARACRAALAIKRREREIAPELQKIVAAKIVTRIGINTGPMAVGNLGSSRKLAITVLGDAVNLGARLEPANKLYGSEVLISQSSAEQVKGQFVMRELDLLRVKGKQRPMAVFELMAEGEPTPALRRQVDLYAQGLAHYRKQQWDDAEGALLTLLKDHPDDGPAAALLARVTKLRHDPPVPEWDGVYVAKEK